VRGAGGCQSCTGRDRGRGQVQAGCPAAAVEPREPELGGELGGELVFVTGELPVDLVVAVTLVSADQPGRGPAVQVEHKASRLVRYCGAGGDSRPVRAAAAAVAAALSAMSWLGCSPAMNSR